MVTLKFTDLTFDKIQNHDPLNRRADAAGMVTSWVARNPFGNSVAFGSTKAECEKDARRWIKYGQGR